MTSVLLYHTVCPNCRQEGADRTGNNLAVYSDDHQWCYRCGYYVGANKITRYKNKDIQLTKQVSLPHDVEPSLPQFARDWLEQNYEFNNNTITNNKILWSHDKQYLIFPYFINGVLEGWQGRVFKPEEKEKRKWFSQGSLDEIIYTLGKDSPCLILTESIISAIKVSRFTQAMPIWGSNISTNKWARLSHLTNKVIIWLDPDKQKEAAQQAQTGRLFIDNVSVILSDKKPKDYTYNEIKDLLNATGDFSIKDIT